MYFSKIIIQIISVKLYIMLKFTFSVCIPIPHKFSPLLSDVVSDTDYPALQIVFDVFFSRKDT